MSSQPRLSKIDLWGQHAMSVMAVLLRALVLLATEWPDGLHLESEMTRELGLRILTARRSLKLAGVPVPEGLPVIDGLNSPTPDTAGTSAERTRPDIQWGFQDDFEPDPHKSARCFHIECKRLGDRELNVKYVDEGIVRFISESHRYGKDVREGAMVGYIIEGQVLDALSGVNGRSAIVGLPSVVLVSNTAQVSMLENTLDRSFPRSPFKLHHAWVVTCSPLPIDPEATIDKAPSGMEAISASP
jgi:hypothetical protein